MRLKVKNRGFSLIEIMIALAIVVIITAISYIAFSGLKDEQVLKREINNLVSILEDARSLTTSGKEALNYGIFLELNTNRTVQFKGDVYEETDLTNKEFLLDPSVVILEVNLADEGSQVIFKRLKGETDQHGTIVLALKKATSTQEMISIYPTGTIQLVN